MKTFYFQINPGKKREWGQIPPIKREGNDKSACAIARRAARIYKAEVRLTYNTPLVGGIYFNYLNPPLRKRKRTSPKKKDESYVDEFGILREQGSPSRQDIVGNIIVALVNKGLEEPNKKLEVCSRCIPALHEAIKNEFPPFLCKTCQGQLLQATTHFKEVCEGIALDLLLAEIHGMETVSERIKSMMRIIDAALPVAEFEKLGIINFAPSAQHIIIILRSAIKRFGKFDINEHGE